MVERASTGSLTLEFCGDLGYPLLGAAFLHRETLTLARSELIPNLLSLHNEVTISLVTFLLWPRVDQLPMALGLLLVGDAFFPLTLAETCLLLRVKLRRLTSEDA